MQGNNLEKPKLSAEDQVLRHFFEIFDFNTQILQDIFDEQTRRSGKENQNAKISLDNIKAVRGLVGLAETSEHGEISIDFEKLEQHADIIRNVIIKNMEESPVEERDAVLRAAMHYFVIQTIIHEFAHVQSNKVALNYSEIQLSQLDWGYETTRLNQETNLKLTFNVALNEAVTETIGREVYREYSKRAGDSFYADVGEGVAKQIDDIFYEKTGMRDRGYENLVRTFDLLMEHVAKELEVPKDKVWEAFKQGYFAGLPQVTELLMQISSFLEEEFPKMTDTNTRSDEWNPEIFQEKLKAWELSGQKESKISRLFAQLFGAEEEV